jgi:hypothetical protein
LLIVTLTLSEDQGLEVESFGLLGGDRGPPEGTDVERPGDHLLESLVSVEGEEPLRLVRVVCPHALVILPPVDAEVEEAARFEDGSDPTQGGGKLAPGQVKQAVECVTASKASDGKSRSQRSITRAARPLLSQSSIISGDRSVQTTSRP